MASALLRLLLCLAVLGGAPSALAFNITTILAGHPSFSTFNHYLTATHLSIEVNRRQTITILALDNGAMERILSKHLSIYTLKNVLSLHVLTDYFGPRKLHALSRGTTLVSSLFQATGYAPGITGFVNITSQRGGKVGFGPENHGLTARFMRSIVDVPYKISVLQIDNELASAEAEAPMPPPPVFDLVDIMTKKGGCGMFARFAAADPDVNSTFASSLQNGAGLTIFCPVDAAMIKFLPKWKNMTDKAKTALLLYHSLDTYNSIQQLTAGSGHQHTIASDGKTYNFTVAKATPSSAKILILTKINTATILSSVVTQQPLAIYSIDKVLMPRELFKVPELVADAPAPGAHTKKKKGANGSSVDENGDYSDDSSTDDKKNAATVNGGSRWRVVAGAMAAVAVGGMALF